MVSTKGKTEPSKSSKRDASPKKTTSKDRQDKSAKEDPKEASSSKVLKKSPSRAEVSKSPSRLKKPLPVSPKKSPRSKSPGRKSPSRSSPARKSPVRKRSPGRSPARKSPARKLVSETVTTAAATSKATVGRPRKQIVDVESDSDNADLLHHAEKPKAAVRGRARRLDIEKNLLPKVVLQDIKDSAERELDSYIGVVRRSVQRSQPPEVERIVHLQHEPSIKKLSEFSDEDDAPISEKIVPHVELKVFKDTQKVGLSGTIGALLTICCIPLTIFFIYISCNETHCSLTKLPTFQRYKYVSTFLNKNAFLLFAGFSTLVAILSAIPFAGQKISGMPNKQGKINYTMNGLFIAAVTFLTVIALEFFNVPIISTILQKYFQLIISGIIIGWFISLFLYIKSFFVSVSALNPRAITNSHLHNFNIGREQNPRILKYLDVKLFLSRIFILSTILLNAIFIYKSIEFTKPLEEANGFDIKSLKINPTLLVLGALQTVYCLDLLIFEQTIITSYFIQHEGVGYFISVTSFVGAFLFASSTKYIYDYKVTLPVWQLVICVLLFCCGYFLYRGSNQQKHAFRLNPYSPSISHLESLSTSQGKKLLVSGFWGFVRHPNYLGDIIMQLSFALFVLTKPPGIACLLDILYLVFRAQQDGLRCKQAYGAAWDRYCQRVKYVLIPKVY